MGKRTKPISLFLLSLISISFSLKNLQAQVTFSEPVQPSPTAANLGKYGDFPVSHHTGVPNISIPIYALQEGPIGLNINLSYHGSGIRVDEVATWAGLGWSLQAGGAITRTIMGAPDEGGSSGEPGSQKTGGNTDRSGWYQAYGMPPMIRDAECYNGPNIAYGSTEPNDCEQYYEDAGNGHIDSQPDLFSFNFGGHSGKFVFDEERKLRILNDRDVKIIPLNDNLSEWKAIGPDGTKFYFGGPSATEHTYNSPNNTYPTADHKKTTDTYFLYKIESANGDHCISISYESEQYSFPNRIGHSVTIPVIGSINDNFQDASEELSLTSVDGKRISTITCSSGLTTINFIPGALRTDLNKYGSVNTINDQCKTLDRVEIIKGMNTKNYEFNYGYFDSGSAGLPSGPPNWVDFDRKRLKLLSVQEISGSKNIPPYIFSYFESETMPRRLSLARDYWGYYNGADNNTGLLPTGIPRKSSNHPDPWPTSSDRNPDESKMKAWTITQIQFPTGGTTTFNFEAHKEAGNVNIVGGLRIQSIVSDGGNANPPMNTTYTYIDGKLYGGYPVPGNFSLEIIPNLYPYVTENMLIQEILVANPPSSLTSTQGNHIGYSIVEEDRGSNGKTRYYYYNSTPNPSHQGNPPYPNIPIQSDLHNGSLFKVEQYDESGSLIQSTEHLYEEVIQGNIDARVVNLQTTYVSQGSNNYTYYKAAIFRNYSIKYGRWEQRTTTKIMDGVTSISESLDYIDQHTLPRKTRITDSDNNIQETLSSFSFDLDLTEPDCSSNYINCRNTFFADMDQARDDYVDGGSNTILDAIGFNAAVAAAQNTFLACVQNSISSQETCHQNHLNSLSPVQKAMLERHMLLPLEVTSKHNSFTTGGTKADYTLLNLDANLPDFILPDKFYKLEVAPDGSSSNWSEEVQVQYDDHGNVIQNRHPDSEEVAYIYGYNQVLPTAKVSAAAINEVAYTSFEVQTLNTVDHGSWIINNPSTIVNDDINGSLIAGASSSHSRTLESHNGANISVAFSATMPSGFTADLRILDQISGADWTYSFTNGESTTFQLPPGQYQFTMSNCVSGSGASCSVSNAVSISYSYTNTSNIYTGFNHNKTGKTGAKAFLLSSNNSISRTNLPPGEYVISYFSQGGTYSLNLTGGATSLGQATYQGSADGWILVEENINIPSNSSSISITGSGYIDELRLHPRYALMTTYSYDDELRVQAVNDPNNRPVVYIYDDLGRLTEVKDHNGNLRSLTEYHFSN